MQLVKSIALVTTQLGNYLLNFLQDNPGEFNSLVIDLQLINVLAVLKKTFFRSTNKLTETFFVLLYYDHTRIRS